MTLTLLNRLLLVAALLIWGPMVLTAIADTVRRWPSYTATVRATVVVVDFLGASALLLLLSWLVQ